jgi:hypothetical protein
VILWKEYLATTSARSRARQGRKFIKPWDPRRHEGFVGRSEAAYGNAEHWERVLGCSTLTSGRKTLRRHPLSTTQAGRRKKSVCCPAPQTSIVRSSKFNKEKRS